MAGVTNEEETGARRAQNFQKKCEQITDIRKQRQFGSITNKDLSKFAKSHSFSHKQS